MRTTVTLDADVEQLLRAAAQRGRTSFKQVLNEAVRRGLKGEAANQAPPFVVEAKAMHLRSGIDPAGLRDLDNELEIQEFLDKDQALKAAAK
ncbi:MAG: antitoxin [Acidobacteria bacterium]|nr:MAG: antitoxin [Acidobacteriota bacterium]